MLDSFQNFVYGSNYVHLKSFAWRRDCPMSSKLQGSRIWPRSFNKTLIKFYKLHPNGNQKSSRKYINHVTHPLSSADISNFSPEISKFCCIKKYMYRLHFDAKFLILLTFLESLKIVLIKKGIILIMSGKMATPGLVKITAF